MSNIPELQGCSQERAVTTTSNITYPAHQPMNLEQSLKFTVFDNQKPVGEIYLSKSLLTYLNPSLQTGLEAFVTPVAHSGSVTHRQTSRTFRRTYLFLQRFAVSVAAGLAVRQLPKIIQKLVEHLPF